MVNKKHLSVIYVIFFFLGLLVIVLIIYAIQYLIHDDVHINNAVSSNADNNYVDDPSLHQQNDKQNAQLSPTIIHHHNDDQEDDLRMVVTSSSSSKGNQQQQTTSESFSGDGCGSVSRSKSQIKHSQFHDFENQHNNKPIVLKRLAVSGGGSINKEGQHHQKSSFQKNQKLVGLGLEHRRHHRKYNNNKHKNQTTKSSSLSEDDSLHFFSSIN